MAFAFVFPGQGSQSIGMLAALAGIDPIVRATFDEASAELGYDLWRLSQEGPREQLDSTENTQPAMLAAGVATWRLWRNRGGAEPTVLSGHSLGEFTSLVCAQALEFRAAVALVRFRGQVMQEAVPAGTGAMAAILGLDDAEVIKACADAAAGEVVQAVNFNSPGQVVIAGQASAVSRAIEAARARGAKKAITLPVSVPSHSSLMLEAGRRLSERLAKVDIRAPRIRCLSAVDVREHTDPAEIRAHLGIQLSRPVRWWETIQALAGQGIATTIECGPGKVLTGLNRRIERRPGFEFLALEDAASLDAALAATQATHPRS
ncbi:MAG TPA: ACP S-malonyltransferase [Steroidobacteraceae bacterium]|nr:ACP S-malonyltransferase [Steroidobacteraceae bacterium]